MLYKANRTDSLNLIYRKYLNTVFSLSYLFLYILESSQLFLYILESFQLLNYKNKNILHVI
jgi:hypothetical protein